MSQVRVLLVDAAVVILETQTTGSNAITLIPSSLPPPLLVSTHQTTRACILSTDITINHRTALQSPALESLRPPSNNDDDDAPVPEAADPRPTTTPIPFPVLAIIGLLALFWCASWEQVIITASISLPVSGGDFWKEITITEKCEFSKKEQKGGIWLTYAPYLLQDTIRRRPKRPSNPANLDMMSTVGLADTAARDFKERTPRFGLDHKSSVIRLRTHRFGPGVQLASEPRHGP